MTTPTHCPNCGHDLREAVSPATSGPTWTELTERVGPPPSIRAMRRKRNAGGPAWWLPSLVYMAYLRTRRRAARALLDEFALRRDKLYFAVVEEQTDDVVGFTLQPWPLMDEHGRLRFPIDRDPGEAEVPEEALRSLLERQRGALHECGLLDGELVGRQVRIGDVFAVGLSGESSDTRIEVLPRGPDRARLYLGGLDPHAEDAPAVPVLDVTWDAREAGKLAHYAAAAGVVPHDLDAAPPAVAAVARETEARYVAGFAHGIDPRDVQLPGPGR